MPLCIKGGLGRLHPPLAQALLERFDVLQTRDVHFDFGCVGLSGAIHAGQGTFRLG